MRTILLNAVIPYNGAVVMKRITFNEAKKIIQRSTEILSYIGHEATASLIASLFNINVPVNRSMYNPEYGDVALVFRLRKRLEKPEDVKNVTADDIEIWMVYYSLPLITLMGRLNELTSLLFI